ncbi:MAG TPA: Abi family protein [Chitinophagaceae bacterium]|nr:Abi family protein [Chitinophagaceae bacterium]
MNYKKPAISLQEQIEKLKAKGLEIENNERTLNFLSNISYYRLRAYTYPFQNNGNPTRPFTQEISLEEIVQLYVFDRRLRSLVFKAIGSIEISFRTQIIYHWPMQYGSH